MNRLRLVLTVTTIGVMTAGIGAAPVTKRPAATRIAPPTHSAPTSGSDEVREPSKSMAPKDEEIVPSDGTLSETKSGLPADVVSPPTVSSTSGTSAAPINLDWYSINNGGAIEVVAGNIKMGLSIGQNAVGEVSAGNIKMGLGFWYGASGSSAPTCACDCHADPSCDSVPNIFDVSLIVGVAFQNGDSIPDANVLCPYETTDVNCNGVTDVFDVSRMVDVAFRNGDPATEFCSPCSPNL